MLLLLLLYCFHHQYHHHYYHDYLKGGNISSVIVSFIILPLLLHWSLSVSIFILSMQSLTSTTILWNGIPSLRCISFCIIKGINCTWRLRNNNGGDGPRWMLGTRDNMSFSFGSVPCMRSCRPELFSVERSTGSSIASRKRNVVIMIFVVDSLSTCCWLFVGAD